MEEQTNKKLEEPNKSLNKTQEDQENNNQRGEANSLNSSRLED